MIKDSITLDAMIAFLNDAAAVDNEAIRALFMRCRVECNAAMADHPSIQVSAEHGGPLAPDYTLGPLGLLNGAFGIHEGCDNAGMGAIALAYDPEDEGAPIRFVRVQGPRHAPPADPDHNWPGGR